MKRVKICSLVTVALMTASVTMPYSSAIVYAKGNNSINAQVEKAAGSNLKIEEFNQSREENGNIEPHFKVTNTSNEAVDLNKLVLGYYYTNDGVLKESVNCYDAAVRSPQYRGLVDKVQLNVVEGKDYSTLQVGFKEDSGTLKPGESMEINVQIRKDDWDVNQDAYKYPFKQSNDYSFNGTATSFVENQKVTAELGGKLIWGVKPDGSIDPEVVNTLTSTSTSIEEGQVKEDVPVGYSSTGDAKLNAIKDGNSALTKGKDYTESNGKVTLTKEYLNSLKKDTVLTFDFDNGNDPTFNIKVKPVSNELTLSLGKVKGKQGETVRIPVSVEKLPEGGFDSYKLVLKYDPSVLEDLNIEVGESTPSESVEDDFDIERNEGQLTVKYLGENKVVKDGVLVYVTAKIKTTAQDGEYKIEDVSNQALGAVLGSNDEAKEYTAKKNAGSVKVEPIPNELKLSLGNVEGKQGETVKIPVSVEKLPEGGFDSYKLVLKYNPSVLEDLNIEIGESTPSESVEDDFDIERNEDAGELTVKYLGENKVVKDGVLVYVTAKIKATAQEGEYKVEDVSNQALGAVLGSNDEAIEYTAIKDAGSVKVTPNPIDLRLSVGKVEGKQGETVKIPVSVEKLPEGGFDSYKLVLKYDPSVLEDLNVEIGESTPSESLEDDFDIEVNEKTGELTVKYLGENKVVKDGVLVYVTAKIKTNAKLGESKIEDVSDQALGAVLNSNDESVEYTAKKDAGSVTVVPKPNDLKLAVGKVEGKQGETVKIPVSVEKLPEGGFDSYKLILKYDPSVLEDLKVEIGESTPSESLEDDFDIEVNETTGELTVKYLGENKVEKDGVLVYVTAKIKTNAKEGESKIEDVNDQALGAVLNSNDESVEYTAKKDAGSVDVKKVDNELRLSLGNVEGSRGDSVRIPVNVEKLPEGGFDSYKLVLKYDPSVLEDLKVEIGESTPSESLEDDFDIEVNETTGELTVKYLGENKVVKDGAVVYVTAKIKDTAKEGVSKIEDVNDQALGAVLNSNDESVEYTAKKDAGSVKVGIADPDIKLSLGKVEAKQGETVKIPVSIDKLPEGGFDSYKLVLKYDPSVLEDLNVEIGESTPSESVEDDFDVEANQATGELTVKYLGENKVVKDGVLIYVTAKVKSDAKVGESKIEDVSEQALGATLNSNDESLEYAAKKVSGSVIIAQKDDDSNKDDNKGETNKGDDNKEDPNKGETGTGEEKHDGILISTDAVTVSAGDTIKIPVKLSQLPAEGLGTVCVNISYDPEMFESVSVSKGAMFPGGNDNLSWVDEENHIICVGASCRISKTPGIAEYITLKVKSGVGPCTTKLTDATALKEKDDTTMCDVNDKDIPFFMQFGDITIK